MSITSDFLKCCHANHLSVRVSTDDSSPTTYEEECDELIPCFQMLYNKTCDDTMFAENKQKWLVSLRDAWSKIIEKENEEYERKQEEEKELDKEFSKEKLRIILIIIGAILLGLLPILFVI